MMKKKIIIMLFILLFISSCQYFGRKETAEDVYTRYHQGHQGLDITFTPTAPPPIVYDQPTGFIEDRDEMTVLVEVRNKGTFDIGTTIADRPWGRGYLLLHGYDKTILRNLKPSEMLGEKGVIELDDLSCFGEGIEGKSLYNAEGGYTIIEFPPKPKKLGCPDILPFSEILLPEGVDYYKPTLVATACYEYVTEASPMVCIDPDPYSERTDKSCRVGGISKALGGGAKSYVAAIEGIALGQGAPVTITNIEEEAMLGRAQFKIYLSNTGGGNVLSFDAIYDKKCGFPSELSYRDFDYVDYIVTMNDPNEPTAVTFIDDILLKLFNIPGKLLDCKPKSPLRLDSTGKAIIHCTTAGFDFYGMSAYKTPLNIKLHYGYSNSAYKIVEIRRTT